MDERYDGRFFNRREIGVALGNKEDAVFGKILSVGAITECDPSAGSRQGLDEVALGVEIVAQRTDSPIPISLRGGISWRWIGLMAAADNPLSRDTPFFVVGVIEEHLLGCLGHQGQTKSEHEQGRKTGTREDVHGRSPMDG